MPEVPDDERTPARTVRGDLRVIYQQIKALSNQIKELSRLAPPVWFWPLVGATLVLVFVGCALVVIRLWPK